MASGTEGGAIVCPINGPAPLGRLSHDSENTPYAPPPASHTREHTAIRSTRSTQDAIIDLNPKCPTHLCDTLIGVPQCVDRNARAEVEVPPFLGVPHVRALAVCEDERRAGVYGQDVVVCAVEVRLHGRRDRRGVFGVRHGGVVRARGGRECPLEYRSEKNGAMSKRVHE